MLRPSVKQNIDISDRLAALIQELEADSVAAADEDKTPFPLWALLVIYEKANHECYINYMEGFKALVHWLSPIAYPNHRDSDYYAASNILRSYESKEISRILNMPEDVLIKCVVERVLPSLAYTQIGASYEL